MESISNMYNFSVQYDKEPSGKWGSSEASFSQNAKNESLSSGLLKTFFFSPFAYDCSASVWLINPERFDHADFTWPLQPVEWSIIYNKNTMDTRGGVLLRPFQIQSWIIIGIIFMFGLLVIFIFHER